MNRQYAVVGASSAQHKFGYIVANWYVERGLDVALVNPSGARILDRASHRTITSVLKEVSSVSNNGVSVSFVTRPSASAEIIREISQYPEYKTLIKGLWFQPGSYDANVMLAVRDCGLSELLVPLGECILVRGDQGLGTVKL